MPDQLTTARDQIAEMCGYKCDRSAGMWFTPSIAGVRMVACYLPYNPIHASLDFVSRVWPDEPYRTEVSDMMPDFYGISTHDARLEYWMCKLLDALVWLRDNDRPVFDAACEKIRKEIRG